MLVNSVIANLKAKGYIIISDCTPTQSHSICEYLGEVIHTEIVTRKPGSKSLVCSSKALPLHTDHHMAKYIGLYCDIPAEEGGDSVLLDTRHIIESLEPSVIEGLKELKLYEHKVFQDDPEYWHCLTYSNGTWQLYYSYWLVQKGNSRRALKSLDVLREQIELAIPFKIKLKSGDLLLFDNHTVLHGRTTIEENSERKLLRYWISN